MNLLILSGSLGRDPERKNFQNSSVVTFSLAETVLVNGEIECPYCGNNSECEKCYGRGDLKAYNQDNV